MHPAPDSNTDGHRRDSRYLFVLGKCCQSWKRNDFAANLHVNHIIVARVSGRENLTDCPHISVRTPANASCCFLRTGKKSLLNPTRCKELGLLWFLIIVLSLTSSLKSACQEREQVLLSRADECNSGTKSSLLCFPVSGVYYQKE